MFATKLTLSIALTGAIATFLPGPANAAPETVLTGFRVAIALDEALTRPLHMGKRYVASGKFQAARQHGKHLTLEATAGDPAARWTPEDPSVVSVAPRKGETVTIRVKKCDFETGINVTAPQGSRRLSIKTICDADTIRADITQ